MTKPICTVVGCEKPNHIKGFCRNHHNRWKLYGDPLGSKKKGPPRTFCRVEGCELRSHGNNLCAKHYEQVRRSNKAKTPRRSEDPCIRYHLGYAKKSDSECWPWIKGLTKDGYGKFSTNTNGIKKTYVASRFGWSIINGSIPEGYFVCHTCDTPACQNPAHWFLGTPKDNMIDKVKKGRLVCNPFKDRKGRFTRKPA